MRIGEIIREGERELPQWNPTQPIITQPIKEPIKEPVKVPEKIN